MARKVSKLTPLPILGIDVSASGEFIAARATTFSQNVRIKRSNITKRSGTSMLGASLGERVQYLTELDNGTTRHFMRIGLTKFEELNKATLAWTSKAGAVLTGTISDQISVAFPLLSGTRILAYTNGKDAIRKYTGTGTDDNLGGTPPLAKYLIYYGGYLLLLNVTDGGNAYPWRTQWSDTGDPEQWATGNAGSNDLLEDSGEITGAGYFGQYFTVHKDNAIYVGYLSNTSAVFRFERKETGAGTIAHKTILTLPTGEQIFLARDGFRIFNGITAPLIDSPIVDELRDTINPANAYKSWGEVVRDLDEAWIAVPIGSDTEPSTIYKFNYVTRQIHKDLRLNVTACSEYLNTDDKTWDDMTHSWDSDTTVWNSSDLLSLSPAVIFGFSTGVMTRQNSSSSDVSDSIDAQWDSKDFTALDIDTAEGTPMEWQEFQLWGKGTGTVEGFYSTDGGVTWVSFATLTLSSEYPSDFSPQVGYFHVISSRIRIRIKNNVLAETFSIKQFKLWAVARPEEWE